MTGTFLVKLDDVLDIHTFTEVTGFRHTPPILNGSSTEEHNIKESFVKVNGSARAKILLWLSEHAPAYRPTILKLSIAHKDLSPEQRSPTLGTDATLPQHRYDDLKEDPLQPQQDGYPVWYFFYGALADIRTLSRLHNLEKKPDLQPAILQGGRLRSWAGKYKALIDNYDDTTPVRGHAFLVSCREHEEILRAYETDKYEVVRCLFDRNGVVTKGLTFRFCGDVTQLNDEVGKGLN